MNTNTSGQVTDPQLLLLARAYELKRYHGACGVYPKPGQTKSLVALERLGLARYAGEGRCIDGETDRDVRIWEITDAGLDYLRSVGEVSQRDKP